jgi:hypothetical protein
VPSYAIAVRCCFHSCLLSTRLRLARLLDRSRFANILRIARLMVLLIFISHWTACAWHGLSEWISGERTWGGWGEGEVREGGLWQGKLARAPAFP